MDDQFTMTKSPDRATRSFRNEVSSVIVFIAILWGVFIADWVLPADLTSWGLIPRTWSGLWGVITSPFLHANLGHLISNTIPLLILLILLCGSRARTWPTVIEIALLGGLLLWLFGRTAVHVGASGLIYGLIAFLIVSGIREQRFVPLIVSVVVGFLYGGTLLSGVLPSVGTGVSWDGHLFGAIAGGLIGYFGGQDRSKTA